MQRNSINTTVLFAHVILALAAVCLTPALAGDDDASKQAAASTQAPAARIKLGVFMESLCPDSRRFFVGQLVPTYRQIGSIMDVELVPFGHARTLGEGKMICQHGRRECEGNRRHACIIARSTKPNETIETIGCLFKGHESVKECISNNLKSAQNGTYDEIEQCAQADESYQMMVAAEKTTGRVGYVPHLTVDGQYSEDIQDQAEHQLLSCMCKSYKGPAPPEACKSALAAESQ